MGLKAKVMIIAYLFLSASTTVYSDKLRLTLDEAIEFGLNNSSELTSKRIAVSASTQNVRAEKSSFYPSISASANWSHYEGETTTQTDSVNLGVDVTQSIFSFGRIRHNVQYAEEGLHMSQVDLNEKERNLIVNIKRAFYQYILAREYLQVQKDTLSQREDTLRLSQERYMSGLIPDFEVLSAESDLESFKPEVISAQNNVELARLAVMDLLNIPDTADYEIELIGELNLAYVDVERESFIDQALANNYDLNLYRSNISLSQYQESLKRDEKKPAINAFASYDTNNAFDTMNGSRSYSNWDNVLTVGVNVSVPLSALLPYSREYAEKKKATLDVAELETNLSSIENSVKISIDSLVLKLNEEKANIKSTAKTEELSSSLYDSAREKYSKGYITRIELREAEIRLNDARVAYLTAIYNYLASAFDLMDVIGVHEL